MEILFSIDEINNVVKKTLLETKNKVILFHGNMGVGKTTLIKELTRELGVTDATSSPTFSLVNEYKSSNGEIIYHFDLYRLKSESEALDIGFDEYVYSGNRCLIEWPEKISNLLPDHYTEIYIQLEQDGKRKLELINK